MGCKMNNKHGVTVSCWVNVCKVREGVDNDSIQFVLQKGSINDADDDDYYKSRNSTMKGTM